MPYVFLNGEILSADTARVATSDRGLLLGDGLFETMRAYGGVVFRLHAHLARLRASAEFLRLRFDLSDDDVCGAIDELVRRNACPEAYVRLTVTRGPDAIGLRLDGAGAPTVILHARPLHPYPPERYRKGARLIVSTLRRSSASPLPRHKTLNYLPCLLARQEAAEAGADGAILLNETGQVTEESVSNLFLVRAGVVWTPPVHCGLLPGVTRAAVMALARQAGIAVKEEPIAAGSLFEFDEGFLTNSLMEIMPVRSVDKRCLAQAAPGDVTMRLCEVFAATVREETGRRG